MLNFSIYIDIYCKEDLNRVVDVIKNQGIAYPVYIVELSTHFAINFESEYGASEIEHAIEKIYAGYEFTEDIGAGKNQIIISLSSSQNTTSSDNWGRLFNSDVIKTKKYLVKEDNKESPPDIKSTFRVLFGEIEKEYSVNIITAVNRETKEQGFILLKDPLRKIENDNMVVNSLFSDKISAFWRGYHVLSKQVDLEFEEYKKSKKRKTKK